MRSEAKSGNPDRQGDVVELWRVVSIHDDPLDPWTPASGRWHRGCKPVIYAASSPGLAMLEALAHLESPRRLHALAKLRLHGGQVVQARGLPADWARRKPATRDHGDAWLAQGRAHVLLVPSVLCAGSKNALIATARLAQTQLQARIVRRFRFDPRLVRGIGSGRR